MRATADNRCRCAGNAKECRDGGGRVSPAVTRRASRRSVRAQLRHTARRPRIMPHAGGMNHPQGHAAIRWSSVDTLGGYKAPGVFPSNGPMARHSLPSTGYRWLLFSCFHGTMKCSDLLSPISPRFVSFAWRYRAVRLCSFPQARRRLEAWSFYGLATPNQILSTRRRQELPSSWGTPTCLRRVPRPRRDRTTRPCSGPTRPT